MKLSELEEREPHGVILLESLRSGLSQYSGETQRVGTVAGQGQGWWLQPPFGVYVSGRPEAVVRRWLQDSWRHTPVRWRRPAQYVVGTLAAKAPVLRALRQRAFYLAPGLSQAGQALIISGNQRMRVLDFSRGITRTWAKAGFDSAGIRREIELRLKGSGPYLPLLRAAEDKSWFEEQLLDGVMVPRLPPWVSVEGPLGEALRELDAWSRGDAERVHASSYAEQLAAEALTCARELEARFPTPQPPRRGLDALVALASPLGEIALHRSHGDLQPGNLLLERSGKLRIIDWEHARVRMSGYDRMVLGLGSRRGVAWRAQVAPFLGGRATFPFEAFPRDRTWRCGSLALFRLEELVWYFREAMSGPYLRAPRGLVQCLAGWPAGRDEWLLEGWRTSR